MGNSYPSAAQFYTTTLKRIARLTGLYFLPTVMFDKRTHPSPDEENSEEPKYTTSCTGCHYSSEQERTQYFVVLRMFRATVPVHSAGIFQDTSF